MSSQGLIQSQILIKSVLGHGRPPQPQSNSRHPLQHQLSLKLIYAALSSEHITS